MKYFLLLVAFINPLFISCFAAVIPVEKLIGSPTVVSIQFNSSTSYYAAHLLLEKSEVIDLVNTNTMESTRVVNLELSEITTIENFFWVDDITIYIETANKNFDDNAKGFIHIDFSNDKLSARFEPIKSRGYLVGWIHAEETKLIFAHTFYGRSIAYYGKPYLKTKLYYATYEQIENDDLSNAEKFENQLRYVTRYYTENNSGKLFADSYNKGEAMSHVYDFSSKRWNQLAAVDDAFRNFNFVRLINSNTLAVLTNKETDLIVLQEYDLTKKQLGKVLFQHETYDLVGAKFNDKTNALESVQYYQFGHLMTEYLSVGNKVLKKIMDTAFKNKKFVVVSEKEGSDKKIVKVFSSKDPGRYYLVDQNSLIAEEIAVDYPELDAYEMTASETFLVKTQDGHSIEVILTRPKNSNGVLLVEPNNVPIGVRNFELFDAENQFYASRGYSKLEVKYHGFSRFGKDFKTVGVVQAGVNIEQDINAVVDFVRAKYKFSKMCSLGASYGAYSAIKLAIALPDKYGCVVGAYGVYDLPLFFFQTNTKHIEAQKEAVENLSGEMREELWGVSPLYFLEKLQIPLLLIGGKKDKVTIFEHTNRVKYRLNQLGKEFESIFYENPTHAHSTYFGNRHEMVMTEKFIRKSLGLESIESNKSDEMKRVEYLLIADGYGNADFFESNGKKAFDNYLKAAEAGSGRAQFNVGTYYYRGELVNYDLAKAEEWYVKASNKGLSEASFRLARIYRGGDFGYDKNISSFRLFEKAETQGHNLAYIYIALSRCLGIGVKRDIPACSEVLKLTARKNNTKLEQYQEEREHRDLAITTLAFDEAFIAEHLAEFKSLVKNAYAVESFDLDVDIGAVGTFKNSLKSGKEYELKSESLEVEIVKDAFFGAELSFDNNDSVDSSNPKGILKYRWVIPDLLDKNGIKREGRKGVFVPELNQKYHFFNRLNEDWELVEGSWILEVSSIDNKLLFRKKFHTKK